MPATILFVDDDPRVLEGLRTSLWKTDYEVLCASGPSEAFAVLEHRTVDVVVSDHQMPGMTGLDFLSMVRDRSPDAIRIMLTGHADTATAIRAINDGELYRFLVKPCDRAELLVTLHLACERRALEQENRLLLSLVRTRPDLMAELEQERARRAER